MTWLHIGRWEMFEFYFFASFTFRMVGGWGWGFRPIKKHIYRQVIILLFCESQVVNSKEERRKNWWQLIKRCSQSALINDDTLCWQNIHQKARTRFGNRNCAQLWLSKCWELYVFFLSLFKFPI